MDNHFISLFEDYKKIKEGLTLPVKLRLYFSTLEELLNKNHQVDHNKQQMVDAAFVHIFQKLTDTEKITFLHNIITRIAKYFKQESKEEISSKASIDLDNRINNIQTSCKIQVMTFGISTWSKARFKLDKFGRRVDIISKQRNMALNLQQYLLRRSRKHKSTIVLEAISKRISPEDSRASIYFTETIFKELEKELYECVLDAHKARLLHILNFGEKEDEKLNHNDHSLIFLTSDQITSFIKYKSLIAERLSAENHHFKVIYDGKEDDTKISRSSKVNKIFKLQFKSDLTAGQLKQLMIESYKSKFKFRVENSYLQQFSKKYKAFYQKYIFNDQVFDQINIQEEGISEKQQIFFSKGVDNVLTPNMLEFVLIKVISTGSSSLCCVFTSLAIGKHTPEQLPITFMLQFCHMINRGNQQQFMLQQTQQEEFFTIISYNKYEEDLSIELEGDSLTKSALQEIDMSKEKWIDKKLVRICTQPYELSKQQLKGKILKENLIFNEWKRAKEGGFVCKDLQMIAEQKKMIKKIIANIGNNIFKIFRNASGIVNMCLPVTVFKKESHLQTISRNFSYAPLLFDSFQRSNDPLERIKACIAFVVSTCTLGISLTKPFNPILGQTFQSWIGGCPLYMQQVSHHPPISSYYFKGRGYSMHGSIEAKISVSGLNGGKCWSEKPNYIHFQDGTMVCLVFAKMLIKNMIIGERQFHFTDKVFVYDMKNNYFAEINFGPRKRGFLSASDPQDYIHGNIYRTTTAFLSKFKSKIGLYPTKDDIAKEICSIDGIWSEQVKFDGKEFIDFSKVLPYQMENEESPLPSNSLYRSDVLHIIKNEIELAQETKDKLEQIQRHDKRLREGYRK